MTEFAYDLAFDRNIGWLTDWEQLALRQKHVAIAGMGGVGGGHLLTLVRLGIGRFTIADLDRFEVANFNRQVGATTATVGRSKVLVLEEMARAINPELHIRRFDNGVATETIDDFLSGVDLFVDGLDFFEIGIRREVFARCAELGIPAITAGPIGMSVAFLAFTPKSMSFEDYFRLDGRLAEEQYVRFLVGLTPRGLHRAYLVDPSRMDLQRRRGPSTIAACQLCAGVAGAAAVQLLLGRGELKPAPVNYQFDAYRGRLAVTRLARGNDGLLQRLKIALGRRLYRKMAAAPEAPGPTEAPRSTIEEILNLARWAPSGDNEQPWRFQVRDAETVRVMIRQQTGHNVYEYRNGEPTSLSVGMLLETMRIAATGWERDIDWLLDPVDLGDNLTVRFPAAKQIGPDPLLSWITLRSVDRTPYRRRPLMESEKQALAVSLGGRLQIDWHEGPGAGWRFGRLAALATDIRLRCPEAFAIHQRMLDWHNAQSTTGIPAGATGLARPTLPVMRWAMERWSRTQWMNRLGGTFSAAVQLDYLPALFSGAFFVMRVPAASKAGGSQVRSLLEAGEAIQRFWLTATSIGLAVQPMLAILAFAHYGDTGESFSAAPGLADKAATLARAFRDTTGTGPDDVVFIGRIGEARPRLPTPRSVRRPLSQLVRTDA
jgi:molybdopterin/thiamine biosynthesis adenylyltransferase/nitroreductase